IYVQEATQQAEKILDGCHADPESLAKAEQRVSELFNLARKYRIEPAQLPDRLAASEAELAELDGFTEERARLDVEIEKAQQQYVIAGKLLTETRRQCAPQLSQEASNILKTLGMPEAH
ncbi:MAG: hypothetical protein V4490_07225, partial [Pseudomonadota bacterium]